MNSLTISPATLADVPQLEKLVNSAYRGETSKKGWTTEADLLDGIRTDEESLKEFINNPDDIILKCSDHRGALLGCVYIQKKVNEMYLGMLTVAPELQNRGIGKKLLQAAEDLAQELKIQRITMTVISIRKELIEWYERCGFKRTSQTAPFPNNPKFGIPKQNLEFIIMEKAIIH